MRKRDVRAANRTTKWCPKSPTAGPWHPKWRPKVTTGASGARPGPSQDGSGDTFWPSFWIFSHFGTPWPRFWEPEGCPRSSVGATNWLLVWSKLTSQQHYFIMHLWEAFGAQLVLHLIILLTTCSYASLSNSFAARLNALTAAFRR